MAAFRILSQSPVYFELDGVTPASGGRIDFTDAGTTTAKDVYGDQALSANNGSSIDLGSDGRAVDDIWGDGAYRVRVYAADGTLISDDDNVEVPGGTGTAIPTLSASKFLTNDGSVLAWDSIIQVPDPTGQSGKIVGSDGTNPIWQDAPVAPTVEPVPTGGVVVTAGSIKAGKTLIQTGTGTLPATGTTKSTVNITFATAMASCAFVAVQFEDTIGTYHIISSVTGRTGTGFTLAGDTNIYQIAFNSTVDFTYIALGEVA